MGFARTPYVACVIVGDTLGGDELTFHPDAPDRILVLAHDDDSIHVVEGGLAAAIEWVYTSGVLVDGNPVSPHWRDRR